MSLSTLFSNMAMLMSKYWKVFLVRGVGYTLLISVIAVAGGAILGALLALGKRSNLKVLRGIITAFVAVVRGTPTLLQLYIGVFLFPLLVPKLNELPYIYHVTCVLILNSSAYVSEIVRSGIEAVDKGQMEAARSLGLTQRMAMTQIILPQAIKNILPALGNEFITVVKETSLASTFFVGEVMTSYLIVKGNTYLTIECLFIVGIIYFVLTFLLTKVLGAAERSLKAHA